MKQLNKYTGKSAQKNTFQVGNFITNFIDKYIGLTKGLILIQIIHCIFCWHVADNALHDDAFCHYSWMRITHRMPINQWYDNSQYTHLDYPPLAAYVHYLLSYIASLGDTKYFFNTPVSINEGTPFTELSVGAKLGLRLSTFIANTLTYNITLAYVVCAFYKGYKASFKLYAIFLFQFLTYYSMVDFGDCQINGPHYALVLLAFYNICARNFKWSTFFLSMSVLYKHSTITSAVPFAMYIIHESWQDAKQKYTDFSAKLKYLVMNGIEHIAIGVATIMVAFAPFLYYQGCLFRILSVLFYNRALVDAAPTLWFTIEVFLQTRQDSRLEEFYIKIAKAILVPAILLLWSILPSRKTQYKFQAMYIVFSLIFFLFSTPVHTKHIIYMYFGWLFCLPVYSEYFTFTNMIFCITMFSQSCRLSNEYKVLMHSIGYLLVSWTFEENTALAIESQKSAITDKKEESPSFMQKIRLFIVSIRRYLTGILLIIMISLLINYHIADASGLKCVKNWHPFELIAFRTGFFALLFVFVYFWINYLTS